mmetsp:Transcript_108241/g.258344  ORF Transcript_108241/g.258344 Transcript_108241/m.258344 type:complete len:335 (-) Transcript_108241:797-1801(-)
MTGSMALSVKVIAGMPPRPRVARLASKKGRATLLATKMAASAEEQSGSTELGRAKTSKTVMAMAKARQTAAQKADAPTMAQRAMKAPFCRSVGGTPSLVRSMSTSQSGRSRWPYTRPSNPPMIIVGATTPAGIAEDSARIVMVHFIRKHSTMVPVRPAHGRTQLSWPANIRVLSKIVEIKSGCGLPPKRGSEEANKVLRAVTVATSARSRHLPPSSLKQQRAKQPRRSVPSSGSWLPELGAGADSRSRQRLKTPAVHAWLRTQTPPARPQRMPSRMSMAKRRTGNSVSEPSPGSTLELISGSKLEPPVVKVLSTAYVMAPTTPAVKQPQYAKAS